MTTATQSTRQPQVRCPGCNQLRDKLWCWGICFGCCANPEICKRFAPPRKRSNRPLKPPCVHCGRGPGHAGRGLCKKCHVQPEIRGKYAVKSGSNHPQAKAAEGRDDGRRLDWSKLKPARPAVCKEHNRRDGECPDCEREQRQAMGLAGQADEEEAAA